MKSASVQPGRATKACAETEIRMTFAERLKTIRRQTGMSQEKLAEKLGVSRQAVTKWETDAGIPDIGNIMAIAALFDISLDALFGKEKSKKTSSDYLFESVTELDIAEPKRYDMKLGGAKRLVLSGYDGEKLRVRLASDTIPTLQQDFKVRIDDIKRRIDVDVTRRNGKTEAEAKENVSIFVQIPSPYIGKLELAAAAETITVSALECDGIELDVKTSNILLEDVAGIVEINCNLDMDVVCRPLNGEIAINQVSACSKLHIPDTTCFTAAARGVGTGISYERNGKKAEPFGVSGADNRIELNGVKSELIICGYNEKDGM